MVLHRVVPVYAVVQVLLEKEKVRTGERTLEFWVLYMFLAKLIEKTSLNCLMNQVTKLHFGFCGVFKYNLYYL